MYTIITPLSRFNNYKAVKENLILQRKNGIDIRWVILTDEDCDIKVQAKEDWISNYVSNNTGTIGWERCNISINNYINHLPIDSPGKYLFLNDDDAYPDGFFDKLDNLINSDVAICSMERGYRTPPEAQGVHAHPTSKLEAKPENMIPCRVGVEQIIVTGSILKRYQLPINACGDGMLIEKIVKENKTQYIPSLSVLFNYFEKGRWN